MNIFWEKSECRAKGWLHRFQIQEVTDEGAIEVCEICYLKKFFKHDNREYLKWHLRQALPTYHPRFEHEYK